MKVFCICKDWQKGMKQIADQSIFCANQAAGPPYEVPMFRYCPWCGGGLQQQDSANMPCALFGKNTVTVQQWVCKDCVDKCG